MNGRVLIVDDSLTVRMNLRDAFDAAGFQVTAVGSVVAAQAAFESGPFALAILDVVLPDGDGVELLRVIKTAPTTADMPVMLLSTEAEVGDRVRGLQTGADEYVGKPYDIAYVVNRARELTRDHRTTRSGDQARCVLVVDDSATVRAELRTALEGAGYAVVTADTGEDGLRVAGSIHPSAVIVDGELPGIDGASVVRRIRLDATLRRTPCLLLTGSHAGHSDELRALDAGADAYVRKSENVRVVLARLGTMLRSAAGLDVAHNTASALGPKRILVVGDSATYLDALAGSLRTEGYDVITLRSGEDALALLHVQAVDSILLDLVMPGLSGEETCRRIKRSPSLRDIPLIMITDRAEPEAMSDGIDAGADDCLSRSSDFALLKARLRAQLRRKQFDDEARLIRERILSQEIEGRAARELAEQRAQHLADLELKNAELARANVFLEVLLENIPTMVFVKDARTLRFERINRAGEELLGMPREALIGKTDYDLAPQEQADFSCAKDRETLAGRVVTDVPEQPLHVHGADRWLHTKKVPLFDEDGAPRWLLGISEDITELKRANEALHAQNAELQAQEEELRARSEALAASKAELTLRNEDLSRASRLKSDFLANMSHELRTPLNAVIGFSDLLLVGEYGSLDEKKVPAVRDILAAGRQLLTLINDVLDLSKIEAGRVDVRCVSVDVAEPVREACSMVASVARARSVDIVNRVTDGAFFAVADPDRLRQVLLNLTSNAVKFTQAGGTVTVEASDDNGQTRVVVIDTGIGIAASDASRLFAPFSQLDSGYNRRFQGTGLGLSICKGLVDLMGGTIGFTSEPGRGSAFFFTLPRAAPTRRDETPTSPPPSRMPPGRSTVLLIEDGEPDARVIAGGLRRAGYVVARARSGEEALARIDTVKPSLLVVDLGLPGMSGYDFVEQVRARIAWKRVPIAVLTANDVTAEERDRLAAFVELVVRKGELTREELVARLLHMSASPALRVLVVDDSEPNRKVARAILERAGCEVIEVADAESGIRAAHEETVGVILMDIQMPGMDGLTATAALKADPATSAIPVIAVTAHAMTGDAERAKAAGCVAYVSKPIARARLFEAIDLAVGGAGWRGTRPSASHEH